MAKKFFVNLDLQGLKVTNVGDGSANSDAATWGQVQNLVRGVKWKAARAATTADITLSGTQTVDTVALNVGDVVLVKNQATGADNGLYVVASGAWTRSPDLPAAADAQGVAVTIEEGSTNGDSVFIQTADPAVVGTDALVFSVFGGGTTYTADGQGIELSGSEFSLELDGTTLAKSASGLRVGSGAAGAGLTESTGVLAVGQGTGVTVAADAVAVDTSVIPQWKSQVTHAAGASVSFTHNLGKTNKDYVVQVYIISTGEDITSGVDITRTNNACTATFAGSQSQDTIGIVVVG